MERRVYLIIGNGALGTGIAAHLQLLGMIPRFLGREGAKAVRATVENTPRGTLTLSLPELTANQLQEAVAIFVAVKAYHLRDSLSQHLPNLPPSIPIVSVGNGAIDGDLRDLAKEFPERRFRWGTTNLAVTRLGESLFSLKNPLATIHWGPLVPLADSPVPGEKALLEAAPNLFHWESDAISLGRTKWLFNTVINTLAGTERAPTNADILKGRAHLELVFREAYALGETHWGSWHEGPQTLLEKLIALIEKTKDNENSMAHDVRLGRKTESDYLAGLARHYEGFSELKSLHEKLHDLI